MVWCEIVWYGMVWYGMVRSDKDMVDIVTVVVKFKVL